MLSLIEMHHQAAGLLMNHIPSDLFLFESLHTSIMHVIEYMTSVPKNMCEAYGVIYHNWVLTTICIVHYGRRKGLPLRRVDL